MEQTKPLPATERRTQKAEDLSIVTVNRLLGLMFGLYGVLVVSFLLSMWLNP